MHDVAAVGVVIPAHDEEDLLPSCLAAVRLAAAPLAGIPVHVVVVADACTDRTAGLARAGGAAVLAIEARNVGTARAAGVAEVLRRTGPVDPATVWLATTDADTLVPPGWLTRQLSYAEDGWDAVVGTITVNDWRQYPAEVPPLFQQLYRTASPAGGAAHPHVHGANLGFSAAAYLAAGGFGPARTAEDHALVNALAAAGRRVLRTTTVSVVTSARRRARAPHGFSQLLGSLAAAVEA
ncbi:MAG TPA: glycosyltransferase family A protein [Streptosporangiaceae bacterium]